MKPVADQQFGRRNEVLQALQAADAPPTIAEVAEQLGVHANTVRFHLETLVTQGRAERVDADRTGPGRPPLRFRAIRQMDPGGPRQYRMLAEILTASIAAGRQPAATARAAGRTWGLGLVTAPHSEPVRALVDLLDEFGFAPTLEGTRIALRRCPFVELAHNDSEVICAIHHGLMQGVLDAHHAEVAVDRLDPFVEPDLCLTHLAKSGVSP